MTPLKAFATRPRISLALGGLAALALAGCADVTPPTKADPGLSSVQPARLSVAQVNYRDSYDAGSDPENVDIALQKRLEGLIENYARNKLAAAGPEGKLDVILEQAVVRHSTEEPDSAIERTLMIGGKDRYEIDVRLRLEEDSSYKTKLAGSVLTFQRQLSVPESFSVTERENAQTEALTTLMKEIDDSVRNSLAQTFNILAVSPGGQPFTPGSSAVSVSAPVPAVVQVH